MIMLRWICGYTKLVEYIINILKKMWDSRIAYQISTSSWKSEKEEISQDSQKNLRRSNLGFHLHRVYIT